MLQITNFKAVSGIWDLKPSGLTACILTILAGLACSPVAPMVQTPDEPQSKAAPTTKASDPQRSSVPDSRLVKFLEKMPLSLVERGIWFADNEEALALADAPHPKSVEDIRALDNDELEAYNRALRYIIQVADFGSSRGQLQEWNDTFGFNHFGIARGAKTGSQSGHPHVLAYVEGNFDAAAIRQKLLALKYEHRETAGLGYYTVPENFHKLSNTASRLTLNSMNHVFIDNGVLITAPANDMLADALEVRAGTAPSLADDPAILGIARSLGQPLSVVILTRSTVLEPGFLPALAYDKPADWGTLNEWELFAAGYAVSGENRLLIISLHYSDPADAIEDAGELERRIPNYVSIVPQLLPGATSQLAAGWPEKPYAQMCGPLTFSTGGTGIGSILTIHCPIKNGINWWELVDMRDLGFLLP